LALANYREYFRGEIIAFSPGFVGASSLSASAVPLVRRNVIDSGFNPVLKYYPALQNGYYAEEEWRYSPFTSSVMDSILELPGVTGLNPYRVMPARARGMNVELKILNKGDWPLVDPIPWPYDFEVMLNAYGSLSADVGDIIDLSVPHYAVDQQGLPYIDSSAPPAVYRARVVGKASFETRSISWTDAMGNIHSEQAYVHSPDVYLAKADWLTLWGLQSSGATYPFLSLGINVENMAELHVVTELLREKVPGVAFLSISEFVRHLDRYTLLDSFYRAPVMLWRGESHTTHPLAQQDFGYVTAILLFLNAGMLLASQMLTAVAGRRNEIGILKAVGARQREVVGMILMEAVIIALIGSSAGFLLIRAAGIHLSITNGLPLLEILATTLRELRLVLSLTVAMSLAFGVLPAWKVARLTVMEVFRNE
jgi:hypothetical protein